MQAHRRALAPQEVDHELLWLLVSLGTVAGLALWFAARLPTPHCAFRELTGLPCLTCGATRAANQFLHGHFAASFFFNPLAFLVYCGVVVFDLYAIAVLITRAPRIRVGHLTSAEKHLTRSLAIVCLVSNWFYLLTVRPF